MCRNFCSLRVNASEEKTDWRSQEHRLSDSSFTRYFVALSVRVLGLDRVLAVAADSIAQYRVLDY